MVSTTNLTLPACYKLREQICWTTRSSLMCRKLQEAEISSIPTESQKSYEVCEISKVNCFKIGRIRHLCISDLVDE